VLTITSNKFYAVLTITSTSSMSC